MWCCSLKKEIILHLFRAYLMDADFERTIDSDSDIVALDRKLLYPYGTPFYDMYKGSPIRAQRQVAARVRIDASQACQARLITVHALGQ